MTKILVADDSIAVRKVAERLLTEAGLNVAVATCADEAIAMLAEERPDVIVSDVTMPDKSGFEVCSYVRAQDSLSHTPVLLISGIINEEVTRQAESCRADGVLKKPFQGSALKDTVLQLLAKREQREAPRPAAVQTSSPAPPVPESAKGFRVTEEQLQTFRQAASRLKVLEDLLTAEREKSAKLAKRCTELERMAALLKETEVDLNCEREASALLVERLTQAEGVAAQVKELEEMLACEREASAQLGERLTQAERATAHVKELEEALACEREASAQLGKRLAEAEKAARRAHERAEELARKLTEIARLST